MKQRSTSHTASWSAEWPLAIAIVVAAAAFSLEHAILTGGTAMIGTAFVVILAVIVGVSFRVAHHAEVLAERFGEPYGTMILTLSAVIVEVVMLAILMSNSPQPTLARDTIFAAVMLDINGIIGIAAIIGGLRHGEQKYNLDASNSYVAMLLVALGIAMFIPDFVPAESLRAYSIFTILVTVVLYAVFLRIQTVEHRYFFRFGKPAADVDGSDAADSPAMASAGLLVTSIIVIAALAEVLSVMLEPASTMLAIPAALPPVLIALISASPEILTAVRAAARDEMQTVINIALGAALATVLLTVPAIELIALVRDLPLEMGVTPVQAAMLLLTLLAAMINLHDGESNVLEGTIMLALFATFVALSFML